MKTLYYHIFTLLKKVTAKVSKRLPLIRLLQGGLSTSCTRRLGTSCVFKIRLITLRGSL